jgi:hypothetical protein
MGTNVSESDGFGRHRHFARSRVSPALTDKPIRADIRRHRVGRCTTSSARGFTKRRIALASQIGPLEDRSGPLSRDLDCSATAAHPAARPGMIRQRSTEADPYAEGWRWNGPSLVAWITLPAAPAQG